MKKYILFATLSLILSSCLLVENKELKAIEICKDSKVRSFVDDNRFDLLQKEYNIKSNSSWLDFANKLVKHNLKKKYNWYATKTKSDNIYIVKFVDLDDLGYRWEVDIDQKIVKCINYDENLSRKYNLLKIWLDNEFKIIELKKNKLSMNKQRSIFDDFFDEEQNIYDKKDESNFFYIAEASILNNTNIIITSASVKGTLKLIFKDKVVIASNNKEAGFLSKVSPSNPWKPKTKRSFYIKTKEIDKMYLSYIPEHIVFSISLQASNLTDYKFNNELVNVDIKKQWDSMIDNYKKRVSGN